MPKTLMIPQKLEDRQQNLFDALVPGSGNCETLEGETLRAINKVMYRFYNDGDYWWKGYGIETAGSSEAFLRNHSVVDVKAELWASRRKTENDYIRPLIEALKKIVKHIEKCKGAYTPNVNKLDMLDCEPMFEKEREGYDEDSDY